MPMTLSLIVKGNKAHAEVIREECREFLEDRPEADAQYGQNPYYTRQ